MQPSNRDGRTGNHPRSMYLGSPAFPDPFAGFPALGALGSRPGGLLSDIFDSDPFSNDPFISRSFGAPLAGGIFGRSGTLNSGVLGLGQEHRIPRSLSQQQGHERCSQGRLYRESNRRNASTEGSRRSGLMIEELPDDYNDNGAHPNSNQEPVVEHPEDDDQKTREVFSYQPKRSDHAESQSRSRRQTQSAYQALRAYTFQSSSVVYGANSGQYYSSQTTRRQGPDGVMEEEHKEKIAMTGRETHRVSRGLNDKARSLTRKRYAEGPEENLETLHNLREDEVQDFEKTWETRAEKSLPKWNKSSWQTLGSGSSSKGMSTLPYSGNSKSNRL